MEVIMKKILIFYASYGGGHLSAAKSIENVINTNYKDTQTKLIDCMKYVNKHHKKEFLHIFLQDQIKLWQLSF